ncbi:hydroxymethylglutaryl-CoA lyase [Planomicrobium stackebrandtii]|uniref:Hydroxymethylglutaryl-CoA lyase n=1 Tax=Planomicrobium stackebrandtii TaxID=253160 RepID=A0ABU0GX45_9BACL|nr:hydroxymethylglutaryl-CoA lyase [Planomicrobium stackebrandtii]MDQ0429504.1 hydroxymethylglutaryl-CoA lyase [Planomicrobium stackebrandtii]
MIEICEVGPRDGLQNEKKLVTTDQKVDMITKLIDAGAKKIEAVSFVNPKVVPQMADAEEVMKLVPRLDGVSYAGLVLSYSGLKRALETAVDSYHVVTATSDAFNLKNARKTVDQNVAELVKVIKEAADAKKTVAGVLGTAFGCPFSGDVPVNRVLEIAETFVKAGATEITLADTTGLATPLQVSHLVQEFQKQYGNDIKLGLHFHNTRGLGLANVLAGYQSGIRCFDSSIGGLGGCPFAPKAVGNVCTEDMVNMFVGMGIETGMDLQGLIDTAVWMELQMERPLDGMMMKQ